MKKMTRRTVLKAGTALAGGMAGILATGRAPAFAQGTTVHWIRWNDFVPASDQLLRRELLPEAEKALGVKMNFETVNANDLQPRITAAIQSGAGPDLFMLNNNHPQLYAESLVDLADVVEPLGKAEGGHYALAKAQSADGSKWLSMPFAIIGGMIAYRKSWFDEVGATKFPETWEQYREVGKKLKAKGRPIGQTLGHTFGDSPTFTYPYMWSWGGKEVEADGKTVNINNKDVIESVKFMTAFWKDAIDEGGLAWDDSNNNRAFLSRHDRRHAQRRLDLHRVAAAPGPVQDRQGCAAQDRHPARAAAERPGGPVRDAHLSLALHAELFEEPEGREGLPEVDAHQGELREVVHVAEGLRHAADRRVGKAQGVGRGSGDDAVQGRRHARSHGRLRGPANRKAAEVLSKYIITDMYAKAVQGGTPEDAVKWAESELKKVYA